MVHLDLIWCIWDADTPRFSISIWILKIHYFRGLIWPTLLPHITHLSSQCQMSFVHKSHIFRPHITYHLSTDHMSSIHLSTFNCSLINIFKIVFWGLISLLECVIQKFFEENGSQKFSFASWHEILVHLPWRITTEKVKNLMTVGHDQIEKISTMKC